MATFALIHGGGGSAWDWHLVAPALRERGHDPVAVDLPSEDESAGCSEYTDTVVQAQGQRGIIELDFANTGLFMFHAHQSEFAELGWMGYFNVVD